MLEIGIKGRHKAIVSEKNTAKTMGSGTLDVLATPALIALMEECAWRSVADELEEGNGTVGTMLEVKHTAATPVGMEVVCESTLVEIDGRKLVFEVEARDEAGVIGSGRHERFIVNNDRFQEKTNSKLSKK